MIVLLIFAAVALAVCAYTLVGVTAQRDEARHEAALLRAELDDREG